MLKSSLKNPALRKRAGDFTRLVRHSVVTPRTGKTHKPRLVTNGELGVTFIGHSSFFLQIGGQNVVIDPNFARWLFVLKRLRQPGLNLRDLPPMDVVLVTRADFDHLHRQSLRPIPPRFPALGRPLSPEPALPPLGASQPRQSRNAHPSPAGAPRAFLDLNSGWMVPMHYGTFLLSHEPIEEPLQLLDREAKAAGVKDKVVVLEEGVTRFF